MKLILVPLLLCIASALHAQTAFEYLRMGDAAVQRNDLNEAIGKFSKALELDPSNQEALYKRGVCRNNTGDAPGAVEDMTRLIALNPNDATFYKTRALNYSTLEQNDKAEIDALKAVELSPKDTMAWYLLGNVQLRLGKTEEAVATLHHYLKLAPNVKEAKQVRDELKRAGFAPPQSKTKKVTLKDGTFAIAIPEDWQSRIDDKGNLAEIYIASGEIQGGKHPRLSGITTLIAYQRDIAKEFPTFRPGQDSVITLLREAALISAGMNPDSATGVKERPVTLGSYSGMVIDVDARLEGQPWITHTTAYLLQARNSSCMIIMRRPAKMQGVYDEVLDKMIASLKLKNS